MGYTAYVAPKSRKNLGCTLIAYGTNIGYIFNHTFIITFK